MANPNIADVGRRFSSDNQPKNRRKSTKFLTELLTNKLSKRAEVVLEGVDLQTGEKRKFKVENPSKEVIVDALLQQAAKGNIHAINSILDRVEGKPIFTAEVDLPGLTSIGFAEE